MHASNEHSLDMLPSLRKRLHEEFDHRPSCSWQNFSSLPRAVASTFFNWSALTQGTDLTPSHNSLYTAIYRPQVKPEWQRDHIGSEDGVLKLESCITEIQKFIAWREERVGPFRSTGGHSNWWIYWENAGNYPVQYKGFHMGCSDERRQTLPNPPLYEHHTHLSPDFGLSLLMDPVHDCFLNGHCGYPMNDRFVTQIHGDRMCKDTGTDCYFEYDQKHYKELKRSLSVSGTFTDVRPHGSTPLKWYFTLWFGVQQQALQSPQETISVHAAIHGKDFVPAEVDSFRYFEFHMPLGGVMTRVVFHAHTEAFQSGLLFSGRSDVMAHTTCTAGVAPSLEACATKANGFSNNIAFRQYVLAQTTSRLLCTFDAQQANVSKEEFERSEYSEAFSRRSRQECANWTFRAESIGTFIGFTGMGKLGAAALELVAMHFEVIFEYHSYDNESHYSHQYNGMLPHGDMVFSRRDVGVLLFFPDAAIRQLNKKDHLMLASCWLLIWIQNVRSTGVVVVSFLMVSFLVVSFLVRTAGMCSSALLAISVMWIVYFLVVQRLNMYAAGFDDDPDVILFKTMYGHFPLNIPVSALILCAIFFSRLLLRGVKSAPSIAGVAV